MTTTISTIKDGVRMYLAQGRGKSLDKKNFRNVFLSPESKPVTVHSAEGGTIVIGIKTAHGLDGQLIPSYGIAEAEWGLVTYRDVRHPFDQENRRWKPTAVDGGWHLQYGPKRTLFLGLSGDGDQQPTLTTTPTIWSISGLESLAPSAPESVSPVEEVPDERDAMIAALKAENLVLKAKVAARDATIATLEARAQAAVKCIIGA